MTVKVLALRYRFCKNIDFTSAKRAVRQGSAVLVEARLDRTIVASQGRSEALSSKEAGYPPVHDPNLLGGGRKRQARHGQDVAEQDNDEASAGAQAQLPDRRDMAARRAEQARIGGEGIRRLGDAHRQCAIAGGLQ